MLFSRLIYMTLMTWYVFSVQTIYNRYLAVTESIFFCLGVSLSVSVVSCTFYALTCSFFLTRNASSFPLVFSSPLSLNFSSALLSLIFLPAILCISQHLLDPCSLYLSAPGLSRPSLVLQQQTMDSTEKTRSRTFPLLSAVTNCSCWCITQTTGTQKMSVKQQKQPRKLHFPEDSEQIWVRHGM